MKDLYPPMYVRKMFILHQIYDIFLTSLMYYYVCTIVNCYKKIAKSIYSDISDKIHAKKSNKEKAISV